MAAKDVIIDVIVTVENIGSKSYVCNEIGCLQVFNSEKSLKKHLCSHFLEAPFADKISYRFNCPIKNCRRSLKMEKEFFTCRKHLHQHFHKVHSSGKFNCANTKCGKMFSTESLRNLHMNNCGKIFTCHCDCNFNSKEALLTHQKRKHPSAVKAKKINKSIQKNNFSKKKKAEVPPTRTVSTTTSGLGLWNSSENLALPAKTTSTFTSTDQPIASTSVFIPKPFKNSSTSTAEDFLLENSNSLSSSSSNQNKKCVNWNSLTGDEDSPNLFDDSDLKMEFYSAETQTDFTENLFNNNYTQTTFNDFYDFEKFDIQTQTNWDE